MNKANKKELGVGIFFAVLSIFYIAESRNVSTFTPFGNRGLDSQSIPAMIGWLSIALSAILIVSTILKDRKERKGSVEQQEQICDPDQVACIDPPAGAKLQGLLQVVPLKLLLSLLFLFFYFLFYQRIGFILSSIFYLVAQSFLLTEKGKRKKWALFIILFSIGVSVLIYFIFTRYFTLFLPRGILG